MIRFGVVAVTPQYGDGHTLLNECPNCRAHPFVGLSLGDIQPITTYGDCSIEVEVYQCDACENVIVIATYDSGND